MAFDILFEYVAVSENRLFGYEPLHRLSCSLVSIFDIGVRIAEEPGIFGGVIVESGAGTVGFATFGRVRGRLFVCSLQVALAVPSVTRTVLRPERIVDEPDGVPEHTVVLARMNACTFDPFEARQILPVRIETPPLHRLACPIDRRGIFRLQPCLEVCRSDQRPHIVGEPFERLQLSLFIQELTGNVVLQTVGAKGGKDTVVVAKLPVKSTVILIESRQPDSFVGSLVEAAPELMPGGKGNVVHHIDLLQIDIAYQLLQHFVVEDKSLFITAINDRFVTLIVEPVHHQSKAPLPVASGASPKKRLSRLAKVCFLLPPFVFVLFDLLSGSRGSAVGIAFCSLFSAICRS